MAPRRAACASPAARLRGQRLEIGDEVEGPVAERRPRAAVDRPVEPRPDVRPDGCTPSPEARRRRRSRRRRISGGGYVSGHVDEEGRLARLGEALGPGRGEDRPRRTRAAAASRPGRYSRMSKTPCPPGSRPVRNVGQAAHECEGRHERETPRRPRSTSPWSTGSSPAARSGSRMSQSAPSQPTTSTRLAMGAEDTGRASAPPAQLLRQPEAS